MKHHALIGTCLFLFPVLAQAVEYRPSGPDFAYGPGYLPDKTHYLKDNGIFWSILSDRWHANNRDSEGDIVQLADGSLLAVGLAGLVGYAFRRNRRRTEQ